MSTAAGSLGYQGGVKVGSRIWAPVGGVLLLVLSAALLATLFTAPAQQARVIERGVPIGRLAPVEPPQALEIGAVLTQAPAFTAASERALNRGASARSAAELGTVLTQGPAFTAASGRALNRGVSVRPTGQAYIP